MPENIIITGGAGFVGRHLITELQKNSHARLTVWDKTADNMPAGVTSHVVDLTDAATYQSHLAASRPAWVIHLAAIASVSDSLGQPDVVQRVNVDATRDLLASLTRVSPATRVLAVSSADIYGRGMAAPLPELPLAQAQPQNPYSQSKWDMEQMIARDFPDRVLCVRPFPHLGPGQKLGFVTADFASQIAAIEAGQQPPVINVGNLDAIRDFTDVRDVVRAYRLLLEKGIYGEACDATEQERGVCGVYHVATGRGIRIKDILEKLLALSSVKITVATDPERLRPADIPILIGDASKLTVATGWQPTIPLEQSLNDVLVYWRSQFN